MFEVISSALIWIMSWVLDRRPHGGEALRLILLILLTGFATWLGLYWRDLAYRSPSIRRRLLPEERYAGRYLQAVWHGGAPRYTIVNIYYNRERKRFEVAGRVYSPAGEELSSFKSSYMLFPSSKDDNIEFVWQGSRSASGYTRMTLEDSDEDYIQGDGLVMTFDAKPKAYPIRFKHLHEHYVREALGVRSPAHPSEEPEFIRKFHAMYGGAVKEGFAAAEKAEA
jgi:hypothetical protein